MPGDNPLVPAFPGDFFIVFIVLFAVVALAIIGGSVAVTIILVRRANSGQPLRLQFAEQRITPLQQNQAMQAQLLQQQQQLVQQQLLQQPGQINNMFDAH